METIYPHTPIKAPARNIDVCSQYLSYRFFAMLNRLYIVSSIRLLVQSCIICSLSFAHIDTLTYS